VLDVVRICEIPDSQAQSAYDAFIMSATTPPKRHNPKAWANYAAKLVNYFGLSKKIRLFLLFC
jgi:hypothetical protein